MIIWRPIAVTLSLARIAHAMSKNKVLCKCGDSHIAALSSAERFQIFVHGGDTWLSQRALLGMSVHTSCI